MTGTPTTGGPQGLAEKFLLRLTAVVLVLAGLAATCMTAVGQRL